MWCEDLLRVSCSGDSAPLDSVMKYKDPATMERNVFFNPEPCKVVCLRREARRCSKVTTTCTRVMCSIQKMIKASKQKALKGHNTQRERDCTHHPPWQRRRLTGVGELCAGSQESRHFFCPFQTEGSSVCLESEEGKRREKKKRKVRERERLRFC